jgi:hypothetical protein
MYLAKIRPLPKLRWTNSKKSQKNTKKHQKCEKTPKNVKKHQKM